MSVRICDDMLELALHRIFIYRPSLARAIRSEYDDLSEFFSLSGDRLKTVSGITSESISKIKSEKFIEICCEEFEWCRKNGVEIVKYRDFPLPLREIPDAPLLLFCRGNKELLSCKYSLSVVGTRLSTDYGRSMCDEIIGYLSGTRFKPVIYSGLALGIDGQAHKSAMKYNLNTIAILPNGIDMIYPSSHRGLANEILSSGGMLITEFVKGMIPVRQNFIRRNRIIAAISSAVVVVESRVKGGAMLTAEYASNYGRDLFAVPGRMNDVNSYGCNYLISKNIAHILNTPAKILDILCWDSDLINTPYEVNNQLSLFESDSFIKNKILSVLKYKMPVLIDYICAKTKEPVGDVSSALIELQIEGLVRNIAGGYVLIRGDNE